MRTFTNWFGKSLPSALPKRALSRTVPVVTSITLSVVTSSPLDSIVFWSRSQASTIGLSPARNRASTRGRLSCGMVKRTPIGSTCVMIAMPLVSLLRTWLPASTWVRPRRPLMGAVIRVYESCSRALSTCAWLIFTVPSSCRTIAACWSTCCCAMESCLSSVW
jgi:hypothetical protein